MATVGKMDEVQESGNAKVRVSSLCVHLKKVRTFIDTSNVGDQRWEASASRRGLARFLPGHFSQSRSIRVGSHELPLQELAARRTTRVFDQVLSTIFFLSRCRVNSRVVTILTGFFHFSKIFWLI